MAYAFVINDMEEIDTFSYDTCQKTVRWLSAVIRAEFGAYDGDAIVRKLAAAMREAASSWEAQRLARRALRIYYRMYCEKEIANDTWYRDLQASIAKDRILPGDHAIGTLRDVPKGERL